MDKSAHSVFTPKNVNELLKIYKKHPEALILAGGTYKGLSRKRTPSSSIVIYISQIEELKRVYKTERYIEIGSCVTLARLYDLGEHFLPPILLKAIKNTANLPIRNLATLGGNISITDQYMDLFYPLLLLDSKLEIRSSRSGNSTKWVAISHFVNNKKLEPGDILTKIRIPNENWNIQYYHKNQDRCEDMFNRTVFCGLASSDGHIIEDLRFCIGIEGQYVLRDQETEMNLCGKSNPLTPKDKEILFLSIKELHRSNLLVDNPMLKYLADEFLDNIIDDYYS